MDQIDALLLLLFPLLHLLASPHTKVEESFNLQATHDILVYGVPTTDMRERLASTYDHFAFPGAVPRTFVGAVVLAGLGQPVLALVGFRHAQVVVRGILGLFNAVSLLVFRGALGVAFGGRVAAWWTCFVVSQFHLMYYLTRTLPNMFAFGLTTLAFAFLLPKPDARLASIRRRQAIGLLVLATTIFRSEIAILLATTGLHLLITRQITLAALISVSLGSFIAALLISVPVDSYFWQRPLWPELWGFYYNAVLGSSSNWGTSPWHYYLTSALPRFLLNPLAIPLIVLSVLLPGTSSQAKTLVLPSLLFVAIYSFQPHKEARFIFYAIPPLTGAAALAANYISQRASKSILHRLGFTALVASTLASQAASLLMLLLSALNYPGGDALTHLFQELHSSSPLLNTTTALVSVHADVLTCMTGLTLFGQNPNGLPLSLDLTFPPSLSSPILHLDKTEDETILTSSPHFWTQFDYLLMEDPSKVPSGEWDIIGQAHGYAGIEILRPGQLAAHEEGEPEGEETQHVVGLGAAVRLARREVRQRITRGWWVGPRMAPRIYIMRQVRTDVTP